MKKNVFLGSFFEKENPKFLCQISLTENGKRKVIFQVSDRSFERLLEDLKVLKKNDQIPFTEGLVSNGFAIIDGKLRRIDPLGRYQFKKMKNFFLKELLFEEK